MLNLVAADGYGATGEGGGSLPANQTAAYDGDAHLIFRGQQAIVLGFDGVAGSKCPPQKNLAITFSACVRNGLCTLSIDTNSRTVFEV